MNVIPGCGVAVGGTGVEVAVGDGGMAVGDGGIVAVGGGVDVLVEVARRVAVGVMVASGRVGPQDVRNRVKINTT